MLRNDVVEAEGFLFIGDPHLSTKRPGTRKDKDFASAVLDKIAQAIDIANERRLVPVFTGDMFHRAKEEDETLKTRLLRELGRCWTQPISNVGNHDMKGLRLADADSLSVIAESGQLLVARESGPVAEFMIQGVRVGLGCTPYGQAIPIDVSSLFPDAGGVIWVTHHDVAFEGAYPGAIEPFEIAGCNLVINGHMHLEKAPVHKGGTMWCNFGNITRTAIDAINHEPAVWQFSPHEGLLRHKLAYEADVFDLVGRLIDPVSPGEGGEEGEGSEFVDLLASDVEAGPAATAEGTLLLEEIKARFERLGTPPEVRSAILAIFNQAVLDEEAAEAA